MKNPKLLIMLLSICVMLTCFVACQTKPSKTDSNSTPTNEATSTPVVTATSSPAPTATSTPTPEPTATSTPTPTNTPTPSPTPEPTATPTPVPYPSATVDGIIYEYSEELGEAWIIGVTEEYDSFPPSKVKINWSYYTITYPSITVDGLIYNYSDITKEAWVAGATGEFNPQDIPDEVNGYTVVHPSFIQNGLIFEYSDGLGKAWITGATEEYSACYDSKVYENDNTYTVLHSSVTIDEIIYNYSDIFKEAWVAGYIGEPTEVILLNEVNGYPVTKIAYLAFENCLSLTSITIPENVSSVAGLAFENCFMGNLTTIKILGDLIDITYASFTVPSGCTLYINSPSSFSYFLLAELWNFNVVVMEPLEKYSADWKTLIDLPEKSVSELCIKSNEFYLDEASKTYKLNSDIGEDFSFYYSYELPVEPDENDSNQEIVSGGSGGTADMFDGRPITTTVGFVICDAYPYIRCDYEFIYGESGNAEHTTNLDKLMLPHCYFETTTFYLPTDFYQSADNLKNCYLILFPVDDVTPESYICKVPLSDLGNYIK